VKVPANINDAYFAKDKKEKKTKSEGEFFAKKDEKKEKKPLPEARVADQKNVDSQVLPIVAKTPSLKAYLSSRFSLNKNVFPHELKF
jgi:large subunit ribosomal protein L6e